MRTPDPEELIRAAYAGARKCPPPESFLEEELARLSPTERDALMEHAERCPACGAERELARAFEPSAGALENRRGDLDRIVASLENDGPLRDATGGRVVRIETRGRFRFTGLSGLAAAAVIALAAIGLWLGTRDSAPGLPAIGVETTVRGARLEIVRPIGDVPQMPPEFEWKRAEEAAEYRLRLLAVDDTVLWESTFSGVSAKLPPEVAGQMHTAVVYTWQVEGLDSAGNLVARSERARFRVRPVVRPAP